MKLILDTGNTHVKAGIFEKKLLLATFTSAEFSIQFIETIRKNYRYFSSVILSTVREIAPDVYEYLNGNFRLVKLSESTKIPIVSHYKTPVKLGNDRLAGIVAANYLYPGKNVLIIDAGTCITYDMISAGGEYYGGSISPGLQMRFKALNTFTGKLPLVALSDYNELIGTDTEKSILSGVINGVCGEADSVIEKYSALYSPLETLICGGDAFFLAKRLKSCTFATPDLVMTGLNEILDYNEI